MAHADWMISGLEKVILPTPQPQAILSRTDLSLG